MARRCATWHTSVFWDSRPVAGDEELPAQCQCYGRAISLAAEEDGEQALLEVEAVLGLGEDEGLPPFHDAVADLQAAVGGQAVEDGGVLRRLGHQAFVEAVVGKILHPAGLLALLAHADPRVSIDGV